MFYFVDVVGGIIGFYFSYLFLRICICVYYDIYGVAGRIK